MKHPLRIGQTFKCRKFRDLVGTIIRRRGSEPRVDFSNLQFDFSNEAKVTVAETLRGGWQRRQTVTLSLQPNFSLEDNTFEVIDVRLTGGGTGHGPGDAYSDGHYVHARHVGGTYHVRFYQSGDQPHLVTPADIEFISGPEDRLCKWIKRYEVDEDTQAVPPNDEGC